MLVITSTIGLLGFCVEGMSARGKLFGVGSSIRLLTVSVLGLKVGGLGLCFLGFGPSVQESVFKLWGI